MNFRNVLYYLKIIVISIVVAFVIAVIASLLIYQNFSTFPDVLLWVAIIVIAMTMLFGGNYSGRTSSPLRGRNWASDMEKNTGRSNSGAVPVTYIGGIPPIAIYIGMSLILVGILIYQLNMAS